jgi:hypothetical protein
VLRDLDAQDVDCDARPHHFKGLAVAGALTAT